MIDDIVTAEEARKITNSMPTNYVLRGIKTAYSSGKFQESFASIDNETKELLLQKGFTIEEVDPYHYNHVSSIHRTFVVSW